MRSDYFSMTECSYMMGVSSAAIRKIAQGDKTFPLIAVGGRYVIPKAKFFAWYDEQCKNGRDNNWKNYQIMNERKIWMGVKAV